MLLIYVCEKIGIECDMKDRNQADRQEALMMKRKEIKGLYKSLAKTMVMVFVSLFTLIFVAVAWFAANSRTNSGLSQISASSRNDFALATVGTKEQGIYDNLLSLFSNSDTETIDGVTYYIATGNYSFRLDSDKNMNNFYANQDLRPGNKGSFDIYVICNSEENEFALEPRINAYTENENTNTLSPMSTANTDFLYGHILFFTEIDNKGMYSNVIDMSKEIVVNLETCKAVQNSEVSTGGKREYTWGEYIGAENGKRVYKLPVYWVWPEQFGNYIYTGNSYNKNLFSSNGLPDYAYIVSMMQNDSTYSRFFDVASTVTRPSISDITDKKTSYQTATEYYNLYSSWYDKADEWIGENVHYIELGFELLDKKPEDEGI